MPDVEIYLANGVVSGSFEPSTRAHNELDLPFDLLDTRWYPIDGSPSERRVRERLMPDEVYLLVRPEPDVRFHATWHLVTLDLGPYRVSGRLPTPPGFDPAKALARPKGQFVGLRDTTIELLDRPDAAVAERPHALVNRYLVDRAVAPLMLGFYFPGAVGELRDGLPDEDSARADPAGVDPAEAATPA